jgi:hypothetical protein
MQVICKICNSICRICNIIALDANMQNMQNMQRKFIYAKCALPSLLNFADGEGQLKVYCWHKCQRVYH